jgi:putative inorganic carbon (HCO3(-)) transporter
LLSAYGPLYEARVEKLIYLCLAGTAFFLPLRPAAGENVLAVALFLAVADNILAGRLKMALPPSFFPFCLFFLLAGLSLGQSPRPAESLYNFTVLVPQYIFLYWLAVSYIKTARGACGIAAAALFAAFLVAAYGLYQYLYGTAALRAEWVDAAYFPALTVRAYSTLGNPNILAAFLVMAIALCLGGIFANIRLSARTALIFLTLTCSVCLLLTYSRGAWLSLAALCLTAGVAFKRKLLYVLPLLPFVLFFYQAPALERFLSAFQGGDTSALLRIAIWESTAVMIKDHLLTGVGWGAYRYVYPAYDFYLNDPRIIIYHAHNMYLHLAAEAGLPALALFLAAVFVHLFWAFGALRRAGTKEEKALALGLGAVLFSVLAGGLTDYALFNKELASLFWLLSALTAVLRRPPIPAATDLSQA